MNFGQSAVSCGGFFLLPPDGSESFLGLRFTGFPSHVVMMPAAQNRKYQCKDQIGDEGGRDTADLAGERLAEYNNQDAAGEQGGGYARHDVTLSF